MHNEKNITLVAFWIMSLLSTVGIGYVLLMSTPLQLPLAEQISLWLVVFPFTLMYFTGLSRRASMGAAFAILALATVVLSMRSLLPLFPVETDTVPRLIATSVIWMGVGYYAGIVCRSYLRTVHWTGYLFTIGLNLIAISLGEIVSETALLALAQIGKTNEIGNFVSNIGGIVSNYVVFLVTGVFLFMIFGRRFTKRALGRLLSIFTVIGMLSFVIEQFYSTFLYHIFWWTPHVEPPLSYQLFATFALGLITALPSYEPSEGLQKPISIDEKTGILIEGIREGLVGAPEEPLKLATYQLPTGWTEVRRSQTTTEHIQWFRPPGAWLNRKLSTFRLMVYQYGEGSFDEAQFKRATYVNLLGNDATIVEEKLGRRHGVVSHECKFKLRYNDSSYLARFLSWGGAYGYLVRFITRGYEWVIVWISSSDETFLQCLPDVEQFIESFRFKDPGVGNEV